MMNISKKARGIAVVALSATLLLASCSAPQDADAAATPEAVPSSASSTATTIAIVNALTDGVSYDYIPRYSNEALAETAEVVATGSILKIQEGPTYGRFDDDFSDMETVILTIRALDIAKGDVEQGDELNLVLYTSAYSDLDAWNKALPEGTGVAVYLTMMSSEAPTDPVEAGIDVKGLDAFSGIDLYATGPQGLAVQTEGNTIYWPWTDVTREGDIEQALPGGSAVGVLTEEEASRNDVEG